MPKYLQIPLLFIVLCLGFAARLSILGWLFIFGFASMAIFGGIHLFVHHYARNFLTTKPAKSIPLILISHLLFLNLFLFQSDQGDGSKYVAIEMIFGRDFLFGIADYSSNILWASMVLYLYVSVTIILFARRFQPIDGKKVIVRAAMAVGILFVLLLMFLFILL